MVKKVTKTVKKGTDKLTIREAAELVSKSSQAIEQAIKNGNYKKEKINNRFYVNRADVLAYHGVAGEEKAPKENTVFDYKSKKLEYESKLKELQFKLKSGEIVLFADVERGISEALQWLSHSVNNFGLAVSAKLGSDRRENAQIIQEELNAILSKLQESLADAKNKFKS